LASKRSFSTGIGWQDVALAWERFEASEGVTIRMTVQSTLTKGLADLLVTAVAENQALEPGAAGRLVSASATCLGSRLLTLEAVLFHLLYVLDFQSVAAEYVRNE